MGASFRNFICKRQVLRIAVRVPLVTSVSQGAPSSRTSIRYDGIEGTAIIDTSPGNLNGEVPTPFRLQSSLENVQEFRVDSNNYPAEQGTGTGGQINVVTKSGSKDFHGSIFEYFRNSALDAANFFDNSNPLVPKSPLRLNQYGGSVGGPIIKKESLLLFFLRRLSAARRHQYH